MKLRNCPFCKADVNTDIPFCGVHYNNVLEKWLFNHTCGDKVPVEVCITVYGETEEEVYRRWNGEEHPTD